MSVLVRPWRDADAAALDDAVDASIGSVGLHPRVAAGGLEIGYWVHAAHVGRGVATAMVTQIGEIAFQDPAVTHVEIHHDTANALSGRIPAALGFTCVGEAPGPAARPPAGTGIDLVWRLERPAGARPASGR